MRIGSYFEKGRSLLETIAVLVVIAILTIAGITGYSFLVEKVHEKETVKRVSELVVRYKLKRVQPKEGKLVQIKAVYPEADRADSVTMTTPDTPTGRVSLQLFDNTSAFAVVVQEVKINSCQEILELGDYEAIVAGEDVDANAAESLNAYSRDYLLNTAEGQEIIKKLCKSGSVMVALISDSNCPSSGASYWYRGRCWNCPSSLKEDKYGKCCKTFNECGICSCPNGVCDSAKKLCVECTKKDDCKGKGNKTECDLATNKCVECLDVGERCLNKPDEEYCMKNRTCQPCDTTKGMVWDKVLDTCVCKTPLAKQGEACYGSCCAEGTSCHNNVCVECWEDYNPEEPLKLGSCKADKPLCKNFVCEGCPQPLPETMGATCVGVCGCGKGLSCEDGKCSCPDPMSRLGDVYNPVCGCGEGVPTAPGTDGVRLCCAEGQVNSNGHCCNSDEVYLAEGEWASCCPKDHILSEGHCCPVGTTYLSEGGVGSCCPNGNILSNGHCCPPEKPEWKPGATEEEGRCCQVGYQNTNGHCCPPERPFWNGSRCVECLQNSDCKDADGNEDLHKFCSADNVCTPCSTTDKRVLRRTSDATQCTCPDGFRVDCGSKKATMSCQNGGNLKCKPGCTQHVDCEENYRCSCTGDTCKNEEGKVGTCEPCPASKPLRPRESYEGCRPGSTCECDLNDPKCPATCCRDEEGKLCDYKNDPEHCPPAKCCDPKEDPETCPPVCDPKEDACCAAGANCCGACEKYVAHQGCVSLCTEGQACVSYNKKTHVCGESQCINVLSKDKLIQKKGSLNGRTFYFPPAKVKYRMTHAAASRFCEHYGLHLAPVLEACLKNYSFDSGHDCANFVGQHSFTDRGQKYNLKDWDLGTNGTFWLADLNGNMALRVTYSCGNNHESHVCNNFYPLCTD